jgi:hypothetical protein
MPGLPATTKSSAERSPLLEASPATVEPWLWPMTVVWLVSAPPWAVSRPSMKLFSFGEP